MIPAHKELDKFLDRKAAVFHQAIMNLAHEKFTGGDLEGARKDLAETIQRTLILADFHGRKRLLMEYDASKAKAAKFSEVPETSPIAPGLTFEEAVEDMLIREPRLAKSAAEVSRLYSTQKVFAMARSAEMVITKRAQEAISQFIRSGEPAEAISKTIQEIGPFSEAYANTVYRTNVVTAYNEGRMQQATDEDIADVIVGFRYSGILDNFTRDNHRAGFGTIAATDDAIWKTHKPPNGYNCRCGLDFVSRFEAERLGLWKNEKLVPHYVGGQAFHPDPGFKVGDF